jgi:hypothetical protein
VLPIWISVSVTQGGLTTLTRMPRGASRAAARVKPSRPQLTRLMAALLCIGIRARMPLVVVIEPPSFTEAKLVAQRERKVLVGELGQRLPGAAAGRADDGIEPAGAGVHLRDGGWVGDIDAEVRAAAAGGEHFVARGKRFDDLAADGAVSADDQNSHARIVSRSSAASSDISSGGGAFACTTADFECSRAREMSGGADFEGTRDEKISGGAAFRIHAVSQRVWRGSFRMCAESKNVWRGGLSNARAE